ncbi:VQ motif-containing protein 4-like [Vitis riparia]|uniref:VQ motif-containing protein 4-like n=1 Tax=Vitis riparia TaxID=96939 RepID=UPI00155A16DC|nr:VQ motif-containing protein 4-like [Vitis riparia]
MENTVKTQDREKTSPITSPNSNGSNCSSSSNSTGLQIQTPPLTPKPISRSDSNPYPTTFVQADANSFKQVVQRLTGSSKPTQDPPAKACNIPPIRTGQKKQGFKLYERRSQLKNGLMINPLVHGYVQNNSGFSPRKPEILSPSLLDFPKLVLSPVTPLTEDPFNKSSEEKAIAEKGFYLHPSPMSTPRDSEPQLLPLFPVTSPRVSGSSS